MFSMFRRNISELWIKFTNPQDFLSAFIVAVSFLRFAGMFPYNLVDGKFKISGINAVITMLHIIIYMSLNISLLYNNPMAFTKPLIVESSSFPVAANVILKLLGIIITVIAFVKILMGMRRILELLNGYNSIMEKLIDLGIDTKRIYKKILIFSTTATVSVGVMCAYTLAHSIVFYEKLTGEEPSIHFFYLAVMSNFYKSTCMFTLMSYLSTSYYVISLLNGFLDKVLKTEMSRGETTRNKLRLSGF